MNDSSKGRYDTILGRYILAALGLNLKLSDHAIKSNDGNFKGLTAPMVDICWYEFKDLNTGKITTEEFSMNTYTEEIHKS